MARAHSKGIGQEIVEHIHEEIPFRKLIDIRKAVIIHLVSGTCWTIIKAWNTMLLFKYLLKERESQTFCL